MKNKMLQGEDSRGSGGYKIINCDVFKPIAEPHSARLRDWMERLEINTHISGKGLNNLTL